MLIRISPSRLVLMFLLLKSLPLYGQRTTVLVNAFDNQTGDRRLDWIGEGIATAVADRLTARSLYVFGRDERSAGYERLGIPEPLSVSRATSIKMAWDMGADILVTGRTSGDANELRIDARVLNLVENSIALDLTVTGKLDGLLPMAASLASRLAGVLGPGVPPESDGAISSPVPLSAFEAYVRGVMSIDSQRRVELLQEAIRLHPRYMSAIYQLGLVHYLDSDYNISTQLLERIPPDVPEYPMARFMIGMNAYHIDDYARAAAVFSTLGPDYDILLNLGASLAASGDLAGAAGVLKLAAEQDPSASEAAFNLGYVAFMRGQWEVAASQMSLFLQTRGRDSEVLFLLGQTYSRLARSDESRRLIAQAIRQSPALERWVNQGVPKLLRVRTQFDATELRMPGGVWNETRRARKAAAP